MPEVESGIVTEFNYVNFKRFTYEHLVIPANLPPDLVRLLGDYVFYMLNAPQDGGFCFKIDELKEKVRLLRELTKECDEDDAVGSKFFQGYERYGDELTETESGHQARRYLDYLFYQIDLFGILPSNEDLNETLEKRGCKDQKLLQIYHGIYCLEQMAEVVSDNRSLDAQSILLYTLSQKTGKQYGGVNPAWLLNYIRELRLEKAKPR